jgi:hypothetical protein
MHCIPSLGTHTLYFVGWAKFLLFRALHESVCTMNYSLLLGHDRCSLCQLLCLSQRIPITHHQVLWPCSGVNRTALTHFRDQMRGTYEDHTAHGVRSSGNATVQHGVVWIENVCASVCLICLSGKHFDLQPSGGHRFGTHLPPLSFPVVILEKSLIVGHSVLSINESSFHYAMPRVNG